MCVVLRKGIRRNVTLNALRPRRLSRPLARVFAGEFPAQASLHRYSANGWLLPFSFYMFISGAVTPFDHFLCGEKEQGWCVLMGRSDRPITEAREGERVRQTPPAQSPIQLEGAGGGGGGGE